MTGDSGKVDGTVAEGEGDRAAIDNGLDLETGEIDSLTGALESPVDDGADEVEDVAMGDEAVEVVGREASVAAEADAGTERDNTSADVSASREEDDEIRVENAIEDGAELSSEGADGPGGKPESAADEAVTESIAEEAGVALSPEDVDAPSGGDASSDDVGLEGSEVERDISPVSDRDGVAPVVVLDETRDAASSERTATEPSSEFSREEGDRTATLLTSEYQRREAAGEAAPLSSIVVDVEEEPVVAEVSSIVLDVEEGRVGVLTTTDYNALYRLSGR